MPENIFLDMINGADTVHNFNSDAVREQKF